MKDKKNIAVLWDMDGVIADTGNAHMRSWQEVFREKAITVSGEDFQHVFGMKSDLILKYFFGREATPEEYDDITTRKEIIFRRNYRDHVKPFPGAIRLIKSIPATGIKQALVSSTPKENVDMILGALGLVNYFSVILAGGDVTDGKPSPQGYLLAAQKFGVLPANCLVIEDAVVGVASAKAGKMKCLAVTNTNPAGELKDADMVVESLENVDIKMIEKLLDYHSYLRFQ